MPIIQTNASAWLEGNMLILYKLFASNCILNTKNSKKGYQTKIIIVKRYCVIQQLCHIVYCTGNKAYEQKIQAKLF